jgi:hypothetical protein
MRPRRSSRSCGLVRIRVGLTYSPENMLAMLAIYGLAALPFFTGGAVIAIAFARLTPRINELYAADLLGAAAGCVLLIPLLNSLGAPWRRPGIGLSGPRGRGGLLPAPPAPVDCCAGRPPCRRPARRAGGRERAFRRGRDEGARRRSRAVQQVEFVLARSRVRPSARRLVAESPLQGLAGRVALHGHRLGRLHPHCQERGRCRSDASYLRHELTALAFHLVAGRLADSARS